MKKLIVALVIICAVATTAVYFFIPKTLTVEEFVKLPCVPEAAFRILSHPESWSKWWPAAPGDDISTVPGKSYVFSNKRYSLARKSVNSFEVQIDNRKAVLSSEINLLSLPGDSMLLRWHLLIPAGNSPVSRITEYNEALSLKKDMHAILQHAQTYLSDFKNVYGLALHEGTIADTFLISTKSYTAGPPSVNFVYSLVNKLKTFCGTQGCSITGTPMLNVTALNDGRQQVMVALPVNRLMQQKDSITGIKMVLGKFLITDIVGGPSAIEQAHRQLLHYFQDYHRTSMAIPFEYLVTDRLQQPDSSKWVTRIYAPVY